MATRWRRGERFLASCATVVALAGCHLLFPYQGGARDSGSERAPGTDAPAPDTVAITPGFCLVPAGSFKMGRAHDNEPCPLEPTKPLDSRSDIPHQVTLTHAFEIGCTEVTQASFVGLMGYNPSNNRIDETLPVESLRWDEAAAYCNALSRQRGLAPCYSCTGSAANVSCPPVEVGGNPYVKSAPIYRCPGYRLPTDAEWEYAYRANTTSSTYGGDITLCNGADPIAGQIGWYDKNSSGHTHPVGGKTPNAWGIHDMAGNVSEMTHDFSIWQLPKDAVTDPSVEYSPSQSVIHRIYRSGSYAEPAGWLRAAFRNSYLMSFSEVDSGFRCARTLRP